LRPSIGRVSLERVHFPARLHVRDRHSAGDAFVEEMLRAEEVQVVHREREGAQRDSLLFGSSYWANALFAGSVAFGLVGLYGSWLAWWLSYDPQSPDSSAPMSFEETPYGKAQIEGVCPSIFKARFFFCRRHLRLPSSSRCLFSSPRSPWSAWESDGKRGN